MTAAEIRRLETDLADSWPADETAAIGGWRLGFSGGATRRANSVLPIGAPRALDLEEAIDAVEARYRQRRLPPCFKMTPAALPTGLAAALDARGYGREGDSHVLIGELPGADPEGEVYATRLAALPDGTWAELCLPEHEYADAAGRRAIIGRLPPRRVYATTLADGRPAAAAAATVRDGVAMIWAVRVEPWARRRGVARGLMAALAGWAAAEGATRWLLQVGADNQAARRLYGGLGMTRAYTYHYRILATKGADRGS